MLDTIAAISIAKRPANRGWNDQKPEQRVLLATDREYGQKGHEDER